MGIFKRFGLKAIAATATVSAIVAAATIPVVTTSVNNNTSNVNAVKNDATVSNTVTYDYEPLTITKGYSQNVISSNATSGKSTYYENVQSVDHPDAKTNGTIKSDKKTSYNGSCLFVKDTETSTQEGSKGLPAPEDGFIKIESEATPTTTGSLYWKIPCSTDTSVNNAMKLYGNTSSTNKGTFEFTNLGVYQKLYILCILSQCNGSYGKITAQINYTDGTYNSETYKLYDWFSDDTTLQTIKDNGLFATNDYTRCYYYYSQGDKLEWNSGSKEYEVVFNQVPITVDTSKVIKSLDITLSEKQKTDTTLTVYGVSGQYASNIAPPTVSVGTVTNNSAVINWAEPSSGEKPEYYFLDVYHKDASGNLVYDVSSKQITNAPTTTYTVTGLSEGVTYYAVMRSGITDTATTKIVQSNASNVVNFTTLVGVSSVSVTIPSGDVYLGDTGKEITTTCYGSDGTTLATNQAISSITANPSDLVTLTKTTTSTTVPQVYSLTLNKAGTTTITATSTDGSKVGTGTLTIKVRAPTAATATDIDYTSFKANWSAVTGAEKYYLDVATTSTFDTGSFILENKDVGNVTSYDVSTGLKHSTTYYYRVRASNNSINSVDSNTISVDTNELLAPTLNSLTKSNPSYSALSANFTPSTSATSTAYTYTLEISEKSDFSTITTTESNIAYTATTQIVDSLSETKTYYGRMKTVYGSLESDWSDVKSITLDPIPPNSITCTNELTIEVGKYAQLDTQIIGPGGLIPTNQNVTITAASGEESYISVQEVSAQKHLIYALKAKANPATVVLTVAAEADPDVKTTCTVKITFSSPTVSVTKTDIESISINWTAVSGTEKYTIGYGTGGALEYVDVPKSLTAYTIYGLKPNTTYDLVVIATSNNVERAGYNSSTTSKQPATGLTIDPTSKEVLLGETFTVTSTVAGGTYEATSQAVTSVKTSGDATVSLTDNNKTHTVTADAEGSDNTAVVTYTCTEKTSYTKTCTVTITKAQSLAGSVIDAYSFTAKWKDIGADGGYLLDVATDSSFNNPIFTGKSVTGSSYDVTGLTPKTTYYYRVRYVNNSIASTNYSAVQSVTTPTDVTGLEIDTTSKEVLLGETITVNSSVKYGTKEASAESQKLNSNKTGGNASVTLKDESNKVHTIVPTDQGTDSTATITYTVAAETGISQSCTITIKSAKAEAYSDLQYNSFTANWTNVEADSYKLYVAYDPDFNNLVEGYAGKSVSGSSLLIENLKPKTTYYYKVQYVNEGYTSKDSNVISVKTPTDVTGLTINYDRLEVVLGEEDSSLIATCATIDPAGKDITWSISDESIATIEVLSSNDNSSNIKIKTLKEGTATITASISQSEYPEIAPVTCQLVVLDQKLSAVKPYTKDVTSDGFTIYWRAVESKSKVNYVVNVWYLDDDKLPVHAVFDAKTDKTEIVINKQTYSKIGDNKKYYFTVEAVNDNTSSISEWEIVYTPKYIPWPIIIGSVTAVLAFFIILLPGLYLLWKNSIIVTIDPKKAKKKLAKGQNNFIDKLFRIADRFWVKINSKTLRRDNTLMTKLGTKKEQKVK